VYIYLGDLGDSENRERKIERALEPERARESELERRRES
jgi:hypothetical protein